jgi:hypothetical protein
MISFRPHSSVFFSLAALAGCSSAPTGSSSTESPTIGQPTSALTSVSARPATQSREEWRKAMSRAPLPKEGCFEATHPSTTWKEVPCTKAPERPYIPATGTRAQGAAGSETVGNGYDFSSQVSGTISWAEGSFPTVTGVTSLTDGSANNFSLQLNSNPFTGASPCSGAQTPSACDGWEQFVYAPGVLFIQYWLLNYNNTCPSKWSSFQNNCFRNSDIAVTVPDQAATNLANLTLTGEAGSADAAIMSTGDGNLYAMSQATIVNLNQGWTGAEFNVFGNANGTEATFNSGVTIVVQTLTDSTTPTTAAPSCETSGFTGETNTLDLVANSCCPLDGASPGIQFTESNVSGATAPACPASAALNPDLLWWNQSTGQIGAWLLSNNGTVEGKEDLSTECSTGSGCAAQWSPVDGMANSLLWDNPTSGDLASWVFDAEGNVTVGAALTSTCSAASGCASSWRPVGRLMEGTQSGLLWYQVSTGTLAYWDLSGINVTGKQTLTESCGGSCAQSWQAVLTTDINNDGNTDVLWFNQTTGQIGAWLLNGPKVIGEQFLSWSCSVASGCATTWRIIGAADVNGDGHTDLTWYDATSGVVASWLLDGSGNVTGKQALSLTCSVASGCASTWRPLGFVSFP